MLAAALIVVLLIASGLAAALLLTPGRGSTPPLEERRSVRAWVDLSSVAAGPVRDEDRWGSVETFAGSRSGTLSYYRQVSLRQTAAAECVLLGGEVWCMMRSNTTDEVLMRYTPTVRGPGWNISFECYAPQAGDTLDPARGEKQIGLTGALIDRRGIALAAVDLSYGTPDENYVRLRDAGAGNATYFSESMLPSATYRNEREGFAPERYLVSFQSMGDGLCTITVLHTSGTMVGRGAVTIPPAWEGPAQLVLSTTSKVLVVQSTDPAVPWMTDTHSGAWIVDNLACRGATAPYPLAGPLYGYASDASSVPSGSFPAGAPRGDAEVTIDGVKAAFNAATGRYEADVAARTIWGMGVNYTILLDGVTVNDSMELTTTLTAPHATVSEWWNGWDWVSVFGLDDCGGPDSALSSYRDYHHPLTAYVMYVGGSSSQTLAYPYLEIGLHAPHDWQGGAIKFWRDAARQADDGVGMLRENYTFASRWDAPANGGRGDTYISMANPGNKATYQQLYALYAAGIRIDGRSSDKEAGSPGNHTQLGSWYDAGGYHGTGAGWTAYRPMDLMDAARLLSWDHERPWNESFGLVNSVAENHGVLRVYGHPNRAISMPELLHWIDDPKTNYSLENWKATDGEVASYIYGRWSTSLSYDTGRSDASTWTYNVGRGSAADAGVWNVPVTIAIDIHGRTVRDITVKDGGRTMRMSSGSLTDLHGARIMDSGYDLRNGMLYVSGMWANGSSISVTFADPAPSALEVACSAPLIMRADRPAGTYRGGDMMAVWTPAAQ